MCSHINEDNTPCPKRFARKADLERHQTCVHKKNGPKLDCPKRKCARKGTQGFSRKDHLTEHLRHYHHEEIPKRSRRAGADDDEDDDGMEDS